MAKMVELLTKLSISSPNSTNSAILKHIGQNRQKTKILMKAKNDKKSK